MSSWLDKNKGFLLALLLAVVSFVAAFTTVDGRAKQNTTEISSVKTEIKGCQSEQAATRQDIAIIKTKLENLDKHLEHQEVTNDRITDKLDGLRLLILRRTDP